MVMMMKLTWRVWLAGCVWLGCCLLSGADTTAIKVEANKVEANPLTPAQQLEAARVRIRLADAAMDATTKADAASKAAAYHSVVSKEWNDLIQRLIGERGLSPNCTLNDVQDLIMVKRLPDGSVEVRPCPAATKDAVKPEIKPGAGQK